MGKISKYVKESIIELKKVTWPTKKETYRYTLLVIGLSLSVAAFLGALDFIFNLGLETLITK
ncbi:MAG: preprotein translocase subunit SecE [Patescibacteria group bacterium]|nr:preprotein translocase subunit SecE [Patescibacteria group bacterium]